jgi:hypothetical protein
MLGLLVAARKISAIKIGASTHQACLPCGLPALFVHATIAFVLLKWILRKLICLEQSTSLRIPGVQTLAYF